MTLRPERSLADRLRTYCQTKFAHSLDADQRTSLERFLLLLIDEGSHAPARGKGIDWRAVSEVANLPIETVKLVSAQIKPALDAIARAFPNGTPYRPERQARPIQRRKRVPQAPKAAPKKRGRKPRPVVEFPEPLTSDWRDVDDFSSALRLHMNRHADTSWSLHRAIVQPGEAFDQRTFRSWAQGIREPRRTESREMLARIERRYRLPDGYFSEKLGHKAHAVTRAPLADISASEQRRLAWHLPHDFRRRPASEQAEILNWVRTVIVSGSTQYRRYQAAAAKHRFALRFPSYMHGQVGGDAPRVRLSDLDAPDTLVSEMASLLEFKTASLTALGYQRSGVWGSETAAQKVEHLSLLFGALAAPAHGEVKGRRVPKTQMTLAMLAFPAVWDWYLRWRFQRRGFYTAWELNMLTVAMSLVRKDTGWLRQTPALLSQLVPIPGLISEADVRAAQTDWAATCDRLFEYARATSKEVSKICRVHRDPFEPILPVLEAESPLREYRKITEEIIRLMPNERDYPKAAAEAVRAFLIIRFGLHLGVRQKNLRQLLFCPRGALPRSERALADLKRGELRWNTKDAGWEVFIPSAAFKNADSSFFGGKPFRLLLPDLGGLYQLLDAYIDRHRPRLLNRCRDPGTFFVKSASSRSKDAAYNQTTFYEAWRLTIQRYGIFNPYTGRGAIEGLLPHGPHNVRDVLATHVLKQTGSYQQASYAIQDTPEMVAKHYGRFLPEDKSAMAAQILNQVWNAA